MEKYITGFKLMGLIVGITICIYALNAIGESPMFSIDQLLTGDTTPEKKESILEKNTKIIEKNQAEYESTSALVETRRSEVIAKHDAIKAQSTAVRAELEEQANSIPTGKPVSPNPGPAAKLASEAKTK